MNYQEIVNRIQSITNQHKMLADFGYGDLSDLKVRFENTSGDSAVQADYPYLFLNPGVHQRNQGLVTYNFNMIVMDMARGEVSDEPYNNMLAIQSQCQQYIDDVLAYLYFGYTDQPEVIYSGVTYSPFNERFSDDVSGMTATLTIQVPQPIDNCITPFDEWELYTTIPVETALKHYNGNGSNSLAINIWDIPEGPKQKYKFELEMELDVLYDITQDPAPYNIPRIVMEQDAIDEVPDYLYDIPFNGLTRDRQIIKETFELFIGDNPGGENNRIGWTYGYSINGNLPGIIPSTQPIDQPDAIQPIQGQIKIYRLR